MAISLNAEKYAKYIKANPGERILWELAVERGDLTLRSEKEGEKKE